MENGSKKGMVITAIVGVMAAVAYMYLKNNPDVICNMKTMAKDMAKKTYDKLDDLTNLLDS